MPAESDVLDALDAWKQAMIEKDRDALDAILHPVLVYSHSDARTESKNDLLAKTDRSGGAQAIEFSNSVVRVFGDAAFVKADVDYTNRKDGEDSTAYLNVLHVFVRNNDRWQMVARQAVRRG